MENRFRKQYRVLTESEQKAVDAVKDLAGALDRVLHALPSSRENSLAQTKLEECVMWAVKGITG